MKATAESATKGERGSSLGSEAAAPATEAILFALQESNALAKQADDRNKKISPIGSS